VLVPWHLHAYVYRGDIIVCEREVSLKNLPLQFKGLQLRQHLEHNMVSETSIIVLQNSKGAGVEQRVLQALMAKRFLRVVAQLERADSSVEVCMSWGSMEISRRAAI